MHRLQYHINTINPNSIFFHNNFLHLYSIISHANSQHEKHVYHSRHMHHNVKHAHRSYSKSLQLNTNQHKHTP